MNLQFACMVFVVIYSSYTQIANSFLDCINAKMRAQDLESWYDVFHERKILSREKYHIRQQNNVDVPLLRRGMKALAPLRTSRIICICLVWMRINLELRQTFGSVLLYMLDQFISSHRLYGCSEYVFINIVWKSLFILEWF